MQEYKNKSIIDLQNIISKNTEEYIKLKLVYHIKINFTNYKIVKEEYTEEGIFVLINNNNDEKIIGIVPTKSESIYGEQFSYKTTYLRTFDEIYIIKDFTDDTKHFIHEYFIPKKEISKDKPQIYCDEENGAILSYRNMIPLLFQFIPKEERTKEKILNNYNVIFQSFYDCAKNADNEEYKNLTNEDAVINFLIN